MNNPTIIAPAPKPNDVIWENLKYMPKLNMANISVLNLTSISILLFNLIG